VPPPGDGDRAAGGRGRENGVTHGVEVAGTHYGVHPRGIEARMDVVDDLKA
jgi:hypothetical protein